MKEIMIIGKKLRKENDVSAFGESQTPFTFPTISSNQERMNGKKVPADKMNLRHFLIWFLITFHSMHFYCQLLLYNVDFFHLIFFHPFVFLYRNFLGCAICLSFSFHAHFGFRMYAKSVHVFMFSLCAQIRLPKFTYMKSICDTNIIHWRSFFFIRFFCSFFRFSNIQSTVFSLLT